MQTIEVAHEELDDLGMWGLVALSARCASYILPLLSSAKNMPDLYRSIELMYGVAAASGPAFQYRSSALVAPEYAGHGPANELEEGAADVFRAALESSRQVALSQTIPGGGQPAMNHWHRGESAGYRAIQKAISIVARQSGSTLAMLKKDLRDLLAYGDGKIPLGFFATRATFDVEGEAENGSILEVSSELNTALLEHFRRYPGTLHQLSSRKFEELIATLWDSFGWEVELTALTADGGRDVVAVKLSPSPQRFLIECKRWKQNVGVQVVRSLHGVLDDEQANKGIVATTSGFTSAARQHLDRHLWRLEGRDFDGIVEWLELLDKSRLYRSLGIVSESAANPAA